MPALLCQNPDSQFPAHPAMMRRFVELPDCLYRATLNSEYALGEGGTYGNLICVPVLPDRYAGELGVAAASARVPAESKTWLPATERSSHVFEAAT